MRINVVMIVGIITLSIIAMLVMINIVAKNREPMPLLFPQNALLKQKVAIILSLFACVIAICGFFGYLFLGILINDQIISALLMPTIVASLVTVILLGKSVLKEDSTVRKIANTMKNSPAKFIFTICLIVPIVFFALIVIALPSTLHMLASERGHIVVTVEGKSLWYQSRSCNGKIKIKENTFPIINNTVCGFSENDWQSFNAGDRIKLTGRKSYFGFNYESYEKLTSR